MHNWKKFLPSSDDEDDAPPPPRTTNEVAKRKRMMISDEDDEDDEGDESMESKKMKKNSAEEKEALAASDGEEEEEDVQGDAKPLGEVIRSSGDGGERRTHYKSFQYDGLRYDLEDPVLLVPEDKNEKPYVAIVKDISQEVDGSMMVTGQWFYRPEEAEKKGGGNWESSDARELFYSFHLDEVHAESVMHKCVVHFIPLHKQFPCRKQHPGFIVQRVYDTEQQRLFKLTDKDYEDNKQAEIDLLVQKTMSCLVDLPDIELHNAAADQENQIRSSRLLRKKSMTLINVSRDEGPTRSGQSLKVETPGSTATHTSEYFTILSKFEALTGKTQRDRWLEKLLQAIQYICVSANGSQNDGQGKGAPESGNESKKVDDDPSFSWPGSAVPAVTALEKASHEALSADFQKYNQKMRQLSFNLKNNANLARRLLTGELDPLQISNMTPTELKEGLTAEEIACRKPEESEQLQMTDARCRRCREKNVGVRDIIQTGHGDRYQLECLACGNLWYASRDEVL